MARSRVARTVAVSAVVVIALLAFGFWWFFVRDDAPGEATIVDRPTVGEGSESELDGAWRVATGGDTFAGFRIDEQFPGFDNTAVVRTAAVEGTLAIDGTEISGVTITADLGGLESKDAQPPGVFPIANRVEQLEDDGLETAEFPTATFTLVTPIRLDAAPDPGDTITVDAEGDLTLHGVTKRVTIPLEARWNGEVIDVSGSMDIVLADYDITPPERDFVTVTDAGTLEVQLVFEPA